MKFSCNIPTKNEGRYIEKTLQSIKNQSTKDYEIIVADTNSKDNTRAIARKYGAKIFNEPKKDRVQHATQEQGMPAARCSYSAMQMCASINIF